MAFCVGYLFVHGSSKFLFITGGSSAQGKAFADWFNQSLEWQVSDSYGFGVSSPKARAGNWLW
jgi:hypothetical protein